MKSFALLGAVALITSSASATFTGWSVVASVSGGRDVYKVYANFNNSTDIVLNVFDFGKADATPEGNQIAAGRIGTMQAVHNDYMVGDVDLDGDGVIDIYNNPGTFEGGTGIFTSTMAASDSYVTMQGILGAWGTALDPSFQNPPFGTDLATTAGWYDSTPGTVNSVGATQKVMLLQIARVAGNLSAFTANMTMGYKAVGTTTPLFGFGSFTIPVPAPGALALLGLAAAFGRRRR